MTTVRMWVPNFNVLALSIFFLKKLYISQPPVTQVPQIFHPDKLVQFVALLGPIGGTFGAICGTVRVICGTLGAICGTFGCI